MADPTLVNGQITDAVTQSNVKVVAEAPAMALGNLYQAASQSLSIAMQNAVAAQQQMNAVAQAAAAQAVVQIQSSGFEAGPSLEDLLGVPYMPMVDEENN